MNLLKEFQQFVEKEKLFGKEQKLLLALSGGADSMALFHLLLSANYPFEAAHANFCLRGEESEMDELFVRSQCQLNGIQLHVRKFDTKNLATENKKGIQELARNLRYQWFKELTKQFSFAYILTAHHANDLAETKLFHLLRGSGAKGLTGIRSKNEIIRRPLLFAEKKEIIAYVNENKIPFREDSSNKKDTYSRNFIRHHIIPKLEEIQPAFIKNGLNQSKLMEATYYFYQEKIKELELKILFKENNRIRIQMDELVSLPFAPQVLYEFISQYGYNIDSCNQIIEAYINKHTGAKFISETHESVVNRDELIIVEKPSHFSSITLIELPATFLHLDQTYTIEESLFEGFSENILWLDLDLFHLPYTLRLSEKGDKFMPFGMSQNKKISDYLTDKKIDRLQKENCLVLSSGDTIGAILPYQISNKYRVSNATKRHLKISIKKEG